jgi:hypothetical protein
MMCGSRGVTVPSDGERAAFAVTAFDRRRREHLLAAHAAQARVASVTRSGCNGCNACYGRWSQAVVPTLKIKIVS